MFLTQVAEGVVETTAKPISRIIGFDSQLIFDSLITAVNVFILFFALSYFLFNPVQKALKSRSEKIKNEIENAKKQESDAIALKEEYEKKLAETRSEVEKIIDDSRKNAKKMSEDIVAQAKIEAQNIINRGNKEVEQEKAKAVDELKNQVISISTLLASKIIKENVNAKSEDKLFEEALSEIGADTWQG